jgi:hypothetical protein
VYASWHGQGSYPGVIASANDDGTYDIHYEDGDEEGRVPRDLIQLQEIAADMEKAEMNAALGKLDVGIKYMNGSSSNQMEYSIKAGENTKEIEVLAARNMWYRYMVVSESADEITTRPYHDFRCKICTMTLCLCLRA